MTAFLPERVAIDAYGNGGFRFGSMSHQGSLLVLPSGMRHWQVSDIATLSIADLSDLWPESKTFDFLILGTGPTMQPLPRAVIAALQDRAIAVDIMSSGAAVRTYNILLAEKRQFAAGIIAVAHGE